MVPLKPDVASLYFCRLAYCHIWFWGTRLRFRDLRFRAYCLGFGSYGSVCNLSWAFWAKSEGDGIPLQCFHTGHNACMPASVLQIRV